MRLENAKLIGRNFFNSLDVSLKELPIDVSKIVHAFPNWDILFDDLHGEDGYTIVKYKNSKSKFLICLDTHGMIERKRFTLAHEIGHIILGHFDDYYSRILTPQQEYLLDREANMVAGEILMPYIPMLEYHRWSIKGLTHRFHVSKEAAQVRLDVLNNDFLFLKDVKSNKISLSSTINYLRY